MGTRGPLPTLHPRRRNKRAVTGKHIVVARPDPPSSLEEEARAEWDRVVPELLEMGLLARCDRGALTRYCVLWSDWCDIDAKLKGTGTLVRSQHGLVRNPLWKMRNDVLDRIAELSKELGLGPTARLRAGVEHDAPERDDEDSAMITAIGDYKARLTQ